MQKILGGLLVQKFTFSILSSLNQNFPTTVFNTTYLRTIVFRADVGNNRKTVAFMPGLSNL